MKKVITALTWSAVLAAALIGTGCVRHWDDDHHDDRHDRYEHHDDDRYDHNERYEYRR
ncbi:hypothetical protein GCAAIG_12875 [Candidatus Electronema halotolerans]